jgi:hypothetical protein
MELVTPKGIKSIKIKKIYKTNINHSIKKKKDICNKNTKFNIKNLEEVNMAH